MLVEAGLLSDGYPFRRAQASGAGSRHSLKLRRADLGTVRRLYKYYRRAPAADAPVPIQRGNDSAARGAGPAAVARAFARFAEAVSAEQGIAVTRLHIDSAHALLHRRVEAVPERTDRLVAAGLAAAALTGAGLRVHVITDGERGTRYAAAWLFPVFERLGLSAASIDAAADETARASAYRQDITVLTARELAMDFLRDTVRWPRRGDAAQRRIDRLLGTRARSRSILMQGLPCAVHLDIDSALIDNARTPIVLTRDAHPMHESGELERALELAGQLERGIHYELSHEEREVVFIEAGRRRIDDWGRELGGLWRARHIAELLLSAALVARCVLKKDVHYEVRGETVEWLVQDRLIPGAAFYSKPFITRMVETMEQCPASSQREEAGRISYQRVFNHYVHLCGLCHSLDGITGELRRIYGLRCRVRARTPRQPARFHGARLARDQAEKLEWVADWARRADAGACSIVAANATETLEQLHQALSAEDPDGLRALGTDPADDAALRLEPGVLLLAPAAALDHVLGTRTEPAACPLRILVAERSASRASDRRHLFWMRSPAFRQARKTLVLAADDELFEDSAIGGFRALLAAADPGMAARLLERRIHHIQSVRGRQMYRMRRDLLAHETNMQGLLSFSGRGPYD